MVRAVTTWRNADSGFRFQVKANLSGLQGEGLCCRPMAAPKCQPGLAKRLQLYLHSRRGDMRLEICPTAARFSSAVRWISVQVEGSTAEEHAVQKNFMAVEFTRSNYRLWGLFIQFNITFTVLDFTVLIICENIFTADA